jgi:hypothetical protein
MERVKKAINVKCSARKCDKEALGRAQRQKVYEKLELEAAEFFADSNVGRRDARAFQKSSRQTFTRD